MDNLYNDIDIIYYLQFIEVVINVFFLVINLPIDIINIPTSFCLFQYTAGGVPAHILA